MSLVNCLAHIATGQQIDLYKMLAQIQDSKVFDNNPSRFHNNYANFSTNLINKGSHVELDE